MALAPHELDCCVYKDETPVSGRKTWFVPIG